MDDFLPIVPPVSFGPVIRSLLSIADCLLYLGIGFWTMGIDKEAFNGI